ncbi:diguanylate cyclase [uncultured Pseudodesulfovibrio sp.]|uniref:diguanylate cyclase n=1 Tax=uncultured Pseudodesulfovibrio sp. TaxID=2035858 RepID=UPI0029C8A4E7|nr:diguanylate cyclase [uncultured Pseudodesulfovibrio sp.]
MPKHPEDTPVPHENMEKHLASYLDLIPAIVWRIDIVGNEISFLNSYEIPSHGEKVRAILQNPQLAKKMVLAEDRERFQVSYEQIRNRVRTACSFRLRLDKGETKWFKLMAMPDPQHPTCSIGLLIDITAQVNTILVAEGRPTLSTKIDLIDDPVLLVRFSDRSICAANTAAEQFLQYDRKQLTSLSFQELLQNNTDTDLHKIYESLIFSDRWSGKIHVTDSSGRNHQCSAQFRAVARDEENLLWVTLSHRNDCHACKGVPVKGNETIPAKDIGKAMRKCTTIKALLETMLKGLPENSPTDAIMLSRIFIDRNTVAVTGAGEPFETVPENRTHPYQGSIAENIVRFDLGNHVVMETSKSIKPIDWALFIPRGIQSYYAQPFYEDGILTNVLIFCSEKSHSYDPDAEAPLFALHEDFLSNLARCIKNT